MLIGQGKGKDGAITLGPWLVTADEMEPYRCDDGLAIEVSAYVNDARLSHGTLRGMRWSFDELLSYASRGAQLFPAMSSGRARSRTAAWSNGSPRQARADRPVPRPVQAASPAG
ncbi:hypothetical protein GCM10020216_030620 [Nonomuraea helvata]